MRVCVCVCACVCVYKFSKRFIFYDLVIFFPERLQTYCLIFFRGFFFFFVSIVCFL